MYFYFFIFIILVSMIVIIYNNFKVELFEFFVNSKLTSTSTTNNLVPKKENSMNPTKKVTIASLKDTLEETDEDDNNEDIDESENSEEIISNDSKLTKCPEGYAFFKNTCKEVCHNCKLGKCEFGICY